MFIFCVTASPLPLVEEGGWGMEDLFFTLIYRLKPTMQLH